MPYRSGYSVLPRLQKLSGPLFQRDDRWQATIAEKQLAIETQTCCLQHEITDEIFERVNSFIREQAPWAAGDSFAELAMQLQEDIAVHRVDDGKDWLAACHICFPSGWRPEAAIGRPLAEIHGPVPGMNLAASFGLASSIVNHGPFVRFVWSPVFEADRINYHPNVPKQPFDPCDPQLWLKIERQSTWGFPDLGAALFVMRQELLPRDSIDLPALHRSLVNMNDQERAYKDVTDELLIWLADEAARCKA